MFARRGDCLERAPVCGPTAYAEAVVAQSATAEMAKRLNERFMLIVLVVLIKMTTTNIRGFRTAQAPSCLNSFFPKEDFRPNERREKRQQLLT
jgi:hypothetical protein